MNTGKRMRSEISIQLSNNRIGPSDIGHDDKWCWITSPLLI